MTEDSEWGQLVSLTDFESDPIPLSAGKVSIGRATDNEICLSENKLVSGHHCFLQRDENGRVTLHDTSTNGTLLNLKYKITKGKSKELSHGDEFYVVFKKHNEENNVGYIYQDIEELGKEEGTQEYSPPDLLDATLEDSDCNYISPEKSPQKKRKPETEVEDHNQQAKKAKVDTETKTKAGTSNENNNETKQESDISKSIEKDNDNFNGRTEASEPNSDKKVIVGKCDNEDAVKSKLGSDKTTETSVNKADTTKENSDTTKDKADQTNPKPEAPARDDIEENLQCIICQEIMHDCISLQPCLHTFCAGCYSDWMARSQECPSCRKNVERINKNHIVNNLIEAYLKEHPEKRRPEEDLKELNNKNKITSDMLYPKEKLKRQESSDYSDTDDENSDENDDDDDDTLGSFRHLNPRPRAPAFVPPPAPAPAVFGFGTPFFGMTRAYKVVCRQCPDYDDNKTGVIDTNKGVVGGIVNALTKIKDAVTGAAKTEGAGGPKKGPDQGQVQGPEQGTSAQGTEQGTSGDDKNKNGEETPSTSGGTADGPKKPKEDSKSMPDPVHYVCRPNENHVLCQCCLQPMPDKRNNPNFPPQQCSICYRAYCHAYWGCRKADCLGCMGSFKEMNFGRKAYNGIILDNQYESEIFRDYIDSKDMSVKDLLTECCKGIDSGHFSVPAQGTHQFTTDRPVCYACGINIFKQAAFQYRKTIKKEEFPEAVRNRPDCYWGSKCRTQKNKPHHAKNFNHVCEQTRQF